MNFTMDSTRESRDYLAHSVEVKGEINISIWSVFFGFNLLIELDILTLNC